MEDSFETQMKELIDNHRVSVKEPLKQQLNRIEKFGMKDVEIYNPEDEKEILWAQIKYLQSKLNSSQEYFELICEEPSDAVHLAKEALAEICVRNWKE